MREKKSISIVVAIFSLMIIIGCQPREVEGEKDLSETVVQKVVETKTIENIKISDQAPDKCGNPKDFLDKKDSNSHATILEDGNPSFWGEAYLSIALEAGAEGPFKAEWYAGETNENSLFTEDFEKGGSIDKFVSKWELHSSQDKIIPTKSCDGKSYINLTTPSLESDFGVEGTWLAPRKLVILSNDEVVGEKQFYMQQ